ncbi:MAG: hypothetical protein KIS78_30840, partial [Labilithrix sp.]|nr:hypothetical protein [Labilithrix sp.]
MSFHPDRERLFDLLADRALVGLDAHEDAELAQRVADFSDAESLARELELAAAAVAVAAVTEHGIERMPAALGQRIEAAALSGAPTSAHRSPPAASVPAPLTR